MRMNELEENNNDKVFIITMGLVYMASIIEIYINYRDLCSKFGRFLEWTDNIILKLSDNACIFAFTTLLILFVLLMLVFMLDSVMDTNRNKLRLNRHNIM